MLLTSPHYYRPQRSCGQGYVFTRVCDSVNGGVSRDPPGPGRTPPDQEEPPRGPGSPPRDQGEPPRDQADTPPLGRTLQHTVNERPVRILLEYILVSIYYSWQWRRLTTTIWPNFCKKLACEANCKYTKLHATSTIPQSSIKIKQNHAGIPETDIKIIWNVFHT